MAGRRQTIIRLRHLNLPDFINFPGVPFTIEVLASGEKEIVIPTLVPREQITISYLYFPPVTYEQVNAGIRFDEGIANEIPVLLQRQYPKWFNFLAGTLMVIGIVTILYVAFQIARAFAL